MRVSENGVYHHGLYNGCWLAIFSEHFFFLFRKNVFLVAPWFSDLSSGRCQLPYDGSGVAWSGAPAKPNQTEIHLLFPLVPRFIKGNSKKERLRKWMETSFKDIPNRFRPVPVDSSRSTVFFKPKRHRGQRRQQHRPTEITINFLMMMKRC